ncbi:MAG: ABC transporter substrate-binding protein [Oscillospiraceae bacterium]|nr:ABC transporter substrate-binding protein [Oscillospiraceae bacterium]
MKKFTSLFLIFAFVLCAFSACGNAASSTVSGANGDKLTIGLIQLVEHPSLDEIRTAFETELASLGVNAEIKYQNAQGDMANITTICNQFVGDNVDLIVAITTPAAQGAATAVDGTDIPVIFSAVTDPVAAELVADLAKPNGNVTGTSDAIPTQKIFELADELTPGVTSYGFIYNLSEVNSVSVIAQAKAYLDAKGIAYEEATVTTAADVKTAAETLIGKKVGAIFSPIDNTVASAMPALADAAITAKVPVYVAADSMVADGGLATVGINYTNLGKQTAQMAADVLNGKAIADMPVQVLNEYSVTVNPETAAACGIDVSKYTK